MNPRGLNIVIFKCFLICNQAVITHLRKYLNTRLLYYEKMATKKLSDEEYKQLWAEAKKDPEFHKDIRKFIKITTGVYNLKDYGLA